MKTIKQFITYLIIAMTALPVMAQRQKPVKTRVMTFNIRLENKNDGVNNWEMRYQKVGEFILKQKTDIIGMQEVKQVQLEDLKNTMPDFDCVGVARDDGKQKGEYNPIFYNKKKFNLVSHGTFWLSETPLQPSRGWDAACNRIATWAILQDKETMKSIMFVNTHLDHVGQKAR
ncbi:MAG: endonuclease/exonuclease/phosphatase family protein, partial [Bacteroidaceae bacterium]